jgi:hypothetical protein
MLSMILKAIGLPFVDKLIEGGVHLFDAYLKKQISIEELRTQLLGVAMRSASEVEIAHAQSLTSTYNTFIAAAAQNPTMARVWAATALSQLFVLLWHQLGIPFYVWAASTPGHVAHYPSSGATVDWAYALLMFCLGGGAIALRAGPGSASVTDQLKSLITGGRK